MLTHFPGNARAKGKIERLFKFIQERFISEHKAKDLNELNFELRRWINWYNNHHINRDTGCVPSLRRIPSVIKPANGISLDDVFCLKEERKVAKGNSFSLGGATYAIPMEHNMVAFKVKLHIHPGVKIRVWHKDRFLCGFPHILKNED